MGIIQYIICCIPPQKQKRIKEEKKKDKITMSNEEGWPVSALSWDITLGVAGTSFGHFILSATTASEDNAPESIDHTGITVYGNLYEFGDLGILKTELPPDPPEDFEIKSKYPAFSLRSTEMMGFTEKTQDEFEAWVEEQNNGDFQGSNYNVIDRSCVVFARMACLYLGVPYPENWDNIISWAIKNKKFTSLVGMAGLNSRHAQHKATAYVTDPSKIKDKVKRLYRKIKPKKKKNREKRDADEEGDQEGEEGENTNDEDNDDDDEEEEGEEGDNDDENQQSQQNESNNEDSISTPVPDKNE